MIDLSSVLTQSPSVITRKTGDEYVLVPVTNNIADMNSVFTLNETAGFLWENLNGKRNVEDLVELLVSAYDISRNDAELDVLEFIKDLKKYLIIV
ncbi:MAG TPA: PqqD family protein [Bacteroidales bacterium]|nr:PqqD family protein [Bacteroidales bacterium]